MDYIANKEDQIKEMLSVLGIGSVDELFSAIPSSLKRRAPCQDDGLSEYEGLKLLESLAAKNHFSDYDNYLGAGCYEHHVPALVGAICQKSKFLTAYTPYQGEASQGILQAIFEFQTVVSTLCGLDVANASMYDAATACAEAVLMALRHHRKRNTVLVADSLHPHYRAVVDQYLTRKNLKIKTIPLQADSVLDLDVLSQELDDDTACVLVQSPNFFGALEDVEAVSQITRSQGALCVLAANPMSFGLFKSAGEMGVDIAVGDMQPLGLPMQFGGPHVGYLSCRSALTRQIPGRLVGQTVDSEGQPCFVLTLQAREQHIRREKATSNICSNQALAALATLVGTLWYGKRGLYDVALTNYQRSQYLRSQLSSLPGIELITSGNTFNEFTVAFSRPMDEVLSHFKASGILAGIPLQRYDNARSQELLVAVTETKSKEQLDMYVKVAEEIAR